MVNLVEDWEVLEDYAGDKQGYYQVLSSDGSVEGLHQPDNARGRKRFCEGSNGRRSNASRVQNGVRMKKLQVKGSFFLKDKGRFFKVITVRSSMAHAGVTVLNGIPYLSHPRFSVLAHIS